MIFPTLCPSPPSNHAFQETPLTRPLRRVTLCVATLERMSDVVLPICRQTIETRRLGAIELDLTALEVLASGLLIECLGRHGSVLVDRTNECHKINELIVFQ